MPDQLLAALVSGLDRYRDDLAPARLFTSRDGRSCAVGAMLRELNPAEFELGPVRFWWRHGRRTSATSYGGVLASCPRVRHLEAIFDRSVDELHAAAPETCQLEVSRGVGRWIHAMAEGELGRRHDRVGLGSPGERRAIRAGAPVAIPA